MSQFAAFDLTHQPLVVDRAQTVGHSILLTPNAPPGWYRFRVQLRRLDDARGDRAEAELLAEDDGQPTRGLARFVWAGVLTDEIFFRLDRPAARLTFRPAQEKCSLSITTLHLEPLGRWTVFHRALTRKLALLRAYGCTGRVVLRGISLLFRGRFDLIWRKLVQGLADSRLMHDSSSSPSAVRSSHERLKPIGAYLGEPGALTPGCCIGDLAKLRAAPLLISGDIVGLSGYDHLVAAIASGLRSLGVNVYLNADARFVADALPAHLAEIVRARRPGDRELVIAPPHRLGNHPGPDGRAVLTMWESDRLDSRWVRALNRFRLVIVPSAWGVETFRASGVTVPIDRVPLGHDPLTFYPGAEPPAVCTFGAAGALAGGGTRKNLALIIDLFQRAFPEDLDVRLRVKVTPECTLPEPNDPRIEVLRSMMSPRDLADWYRSLTAFISASAGEGFGLHLLEAMACGVPIVSTRYGGVTEYFDDWAGFPIPHRLVPADGEVYQGNWAAVDEDALIVALQAIHGCPGEAVRRGARAACRARRFTWRHTGAKLVSALASRGASAPDCR